MKPSSSPAIVPSPPGGGELQPKLPQFVRDWFAARGWTVRQHQIDVFLKAQEGRSVLLIAPTGGGKTLASFLPSLSELKDNTSGVRFGAVTAIATALGLRRGVVRRILVDRGVSLRGRSPTSEGHRQAVLNRHAEGKRIKEISSELGLDFTTVYRILRRAGRVKKLRQ